MQSSVFFYRLTTLHITKEVLIIDKKDVVILVLDANSKMLVIHLAINKQEKMPIYLKKQA